MAEVGAWILTFADLDELQAQASEAGPAIGVVRSTENIASSDWTMDWGAIVEVDDRYGGEVRMPERPRRFSGRYGGVASTRHRRDGPCMIINQQCLQKEPPQSL
jgi:crotonobetainyl-CoA:carnitine CoA-transferase CaiB-like acyl-CoA transferase